MDYIYVACGGALGAIARYSISQIPIKTEFPILTFVTNFLGAILIGFIAGYLDRYDTDSSFIPSFWKVGVCGGFTTFSTFSLEAINLIENKLYFTGGAYMILSVLCCLVGVAIGRKVALHTSLIMS